MEEPATWDAAQAACRAQGGNLASIDMSYDQAFVAGVVLQGKADAWIGLRRKVQIRKNFNNLNVENRNFLNKEINLCCDAGGWVVQLVRRLARVLHSVGTGRAQ